MRRGRDCRGGGVETSTIHGDCFFLVSSDAACLGERGESESTRVSCEGGERSADPGKAGRAKGSSNRGMLDEGDAMGTCCDDIDCREDLSPNSSGEGPKTSGEGLRGECDNEGVFWTLGVRWMVGKLC